MGRSLVVVIAWTVAFVGAGQAQAGEGLSKFSVESEAPKVAAQPTAVAKTPQGIECPLGIAQVKALENERFEYGGTPYKLRELAKALRAANKSRQFDCVVIEGGKPSSVKTMGRVLKELASAPVKHVEWGGALPDDIHTLKK